MAAATIAGRSTSTFARNIFKTTTRRISKVSFSNDSLPANFTLRCQPRPLPAPFPSRLLRRELATLVPVHTAISAACLVSKLPSEASTSNQGRFANYLSPI
ncbi:hypothetical protein QYF36_007684 [Acer negundo]|nr:hypothetical protein QYF36_007684 [Acer negundo]